MVKEKRLKIIGTTYNRELNIEGIVMPSVSQTLGVTQYNGFMTLDLNPSLSLTEKTQLKKDLWTAVKMTRPILESMNLLPDMTNDTTQIQQRFNEYQRSIKQDMQ